ncbi:TonB-dependent receptor [Alteromonas stellipolaris]|uniref:TonB-dependent receptor n=1 Tax=Alteromonas stellipolaris TaxID=233316 RepID=UPI0027359244|nr:TonB-dependent receptor [Alteromonas stellipolaris]MDP2536270.1 TonB-dependent receptor [Alteromonas stellipolaris]
MVLRRKQLAVLVALALSGAHVNAQQVAIESAEPQDENLEIIEVSGFRGSLNKSLMEKRTSVNNKESIVAEDIGKFPDLNIAESIQRVPGVAISREGGEGRQITLRGLSPSFTRTTLNGMEVPASTDGTDSGGGVNGGRGFDFNVFASELFNRVDIQKSPTASMEEGGIAGTVDLYSAKPFDYEGFKLVTSVQGGYNNVTEETDPRAAFMISNRFADDKIGVLFSAAMSERTVRQEGFGTVRWTNPVQDGGGLYADTSDTVVSGTPDVGSCVDDGVEVDPLNCLWTPRLPRPDYFGNDQERVGFTGSIQWAPSDDLTFTLDGLVSSLENTRTMYNFFHMFRSTFDEITPTAITVHPNGKQVLAGSYEGIKSRIESRLQESTTDFSQFVLSGEWFASENVKVEAMFGTAESDARSEQYRYNMTLLESTTYGFDFSNNANAPALTYGYDTNDASNYNLSDGRLRATDVERENDTFKVDVSYLGDEVTIKTGFAYNDRVVTYAEEQINGFPDQDSAVGYAEMMPVDDFGSGFDGPLEPFLVADFDAINANLLDVVWTPRSAQSWQVGEETSALYLEMDTSYEISDMLLRANYGVRYVNTTTTSEGFVQGEAVQIENDYSNFLPAVNLALEATDDVVVRLSVTQSMTRPSLNSLNPGNPSFDYINGSVSVGNPFLDPFTSNNVDFGVEWYFDDEALLAATVFYKDIDNWIVRSSEERFVDPAYFDFIDNDAQYDPQIALDPREVAYEHSSPNNADERSISGYELIYQQPLSFLPGVFENMGVVSNYTHVNADDIEGMSETSYNFTLYYETDVYGARVSVNKRDDYITDFTGSNGNVAHGTTGPTQVDFSSFYNFSEALTFTFEIINLTDEYERLFTTGDGSLNLVREYNHTGRQIFLGARYSL